MKTEIICPVNLFALNQTIYICGDDNKEAIKAVPLESLSNELLSIGSDYDLFNYHLLGNQEYLEHLSQELKQKYCLKYNNKNIEVKVN